MSEKNGASNQTLRMAANFLDKRQMKIHMRSDLFSSLRDMPGGTPQETKTGNFLFKTATRGLDDPKEDGHLPSTGSTSSYHTPPTSPATSITAGRPHSEDMQRIYVTDASAASEIPRTRMSMMSSTTRACMNGRQDGSNDPLNASVSLKT